MILNIPRISTATTMIATHLGMTRLGQLASIEWAKHHFGVLFCSCCKPRGRCQSQLKSKKKEEKKWDLGYKRFINCFWGEMLAEVTWVNTERIPHHLEKSAGWHYVSSLQMQSLKPSISSTWAAPDGWAEIIKGVRSFWKKSRWQNSLGWIQSGQSVGTCFRFMSPSESPQE